MCPRERCQSRIGLLACVTETEFDWVECTLDVQISTTDTHANRFDQDCIVVVKERAACLIKNHLETIIAQSRDREEWILEFRNQNGAVKVSNTSHG